MKTPCWRLDPIRTLTHPLIVHDVIDWKFVPIYRAERLSAGVIAAANASTCNENIHPLRICTDSEINVVVKLKRLFLIGDRYIDF